MNLLRDVFPVLEVIFLNAYNSSSARAARLRVGSCSDAARACRADCIRISSRRGKDVKLEELTTAAAPAARDRARGKRASASATCIGRRNATNNAGR